jgi:phosphoglycolate phosphatase
MVGEASGTPLRAFVLWDIDGTLVDSGGLGRDVFVDAFEQVTGAPPEQLVPFAGRTDLEIAADLLERAGIASDDGVLDAFSDALERAMAAQTEELQRRGRALPGARASLDRLAREPGVVQSLLTGNIISNARAKLGIFGLDRFVDFEIGAYGSDHRRRGELVAIACDRAERRLGVAIPRAHTVLIGDTPLDVAAAKEAGARAVGVATGPFEVADLDRAGADVSLADLSAPEEVVAVVLGI